MSELFSELERAAWGGLIETQSRLFQVIENDLRRRFGITHAEFEVLLRLALSPEGRARIQDLAAQSLLSRSGTSRAVERLERAGHVERVDAEEDGRGAYAVLTRTGRAHFFSAAREHVALVRREFLSRFTEDELRSLAGFWKRARAERPAESTRKADPTAAEPPPRASEAPTGKKTGATRASKASEGDKTERPPGEGRPRRRAVKRRP